MEERGLLDEPCREKAWNEMTTDEKLEHLKNNQEYLERRIKDSSKLFRHLANHHHADGKLVVEIYKY